MFPRYDYLEFTDAVGAKRKFDGEVNSERWPRRVEFKGQRLHMYFYSDSSNNEWGYKFTVSENRTSNSTCMYCHSFLCASANKHLEW